MNLKDLTRTVLLRGVMAFCFLGLGESLEANALALNLYGVSYHLNQRDESESGADDSDELKEFNEGVGFRISFGNDSSDTFFFEVGSFQDSYDNEARYASLGYQWRLVAQLRLGITAAFYATDTIRKGEAFFAAVPLVSYTVGFITVNGVYIPSYKDINPFHTLGAYLTISLFEEGP